MVRFFTLLTFVGFLAACSPLVGGEIGARQFFDLETGVLGKIGGDTPHDYVLVPTSFSWRSREMFGWSLDDGARLLVRNRVTLIAQAYAEGPETIYGGFSFSPSLEYWNAAGTWSVFAGAGGGLGWLDYQEDVPGAMGQSLTLNWFGRLGVAFGVNDHMEVRLAAMFQHMSNGGMSDPNPGLDSLGGTIGLTWRF
ncbi:MAG: acyloxyacyl hydrolase [Verrucomicrobiaceae bacterium]|nr:acyloxyacyl hydrolase [Verrucomicrobiaceae bacterium]